MEEYNWLCEKGQIVFTTFHQSLSYEDFVEGIKPNLIEVEKGDLGYKIENGIFKKLCISAMQTKKSNNFDSKYKEFIDKLEENPNLELYTPVHKKPFNIQINSNETTVAIPQTEKATRMGITKQMLYDYILDGEIREWKPYTTAIGDYLKKEFSVDIQKVNSSVNNHVLIIDEINRGNVSSIFGELITLLEEDKRKGNKEEISVELPYSKKPFSVPPNLYIIGTMNTADRSVEALDTALRRRFAFEEVMPKPELLKDVEISGFNVQDLLKTINLRIEALLDRDHTIGHSYFFKVKDAENKEDTLKQVFKDSIIPLLQEYFYGDYSRIGLVLGEGFVKQAQKTDEKQFAKFSDLNGSIAVPVRYELISIDINFNIGEALEKLMANA